MYADARETAFLAVFDDDLPENWNVWGNPFKAYENLVRSLDPKVSEANQRFNKYRFELLLDPPDQLLQRDEMGVMRIVGVIIDPVDHTKYPDKARYIETRFRRLCSMISEACHKHIEDALIRQVGFHILIAAKEDTPERVYAEWEDWLFDEWNSLPEGIAYRNPQTVKDEKSFFNNLEQNLRDIVRIYKIQVTTRSRWLGSI